MNWGTLIGLKLKIWYKKPLKNEKRLVLLLKIILASSFLAVLTFLLLKMFEVPVYNTKITMEHNYHISDSADFNLEIIRNYDRHNRLSNDTDHIVGGYERPGGIFLKGCIIPQKSSINKVDSIKKHLNDRNAIRLTEFIKKYCNPDSIPYESIGEIMHINIESTARQYLSLKFRNRGPSSLYSTKPSTIDWNGMIFDNNHLFCYFDDTSLNGNNLFNYYSAVSMKDTMCVAYISYNSYSFDTPDSFRAFFTAEDVSQGNEYIILKGLNSRHIKRFVIDYLGAVEFGVLNPEPDTITTSCILYTKPEKIDQIALYGLKYHVSFPDMRNVQEIRITAIVMAITLLIGVLFDLFYRLLLTCKNLILIFHNHPLFCSSIVCLIAFLAMLFIVCFL